MRWSLRYFFTVAWAARAVVASSCPYAGLHNTTTPDHARRYLHPNGTHQRARAAGRKGTFYMNRIAPGESVIYIANADGSGASPLMPNQPWTMDYHPSWSPDGEWIVFTSERRGDGQSDLYRIHPNGTGLETLITTDSVEDAGVLSPDGQLLAYVSTQGNHTANVWIKDLISGVERALTDSPDLDRTKPQGHFRPAWSPDGQWIVFSSDRNTEWTGHGEGTGWEHTQTLSIYKVRPDGTDLRLVYSEAGYSIGTPSWSPDGSRLLCNRVAVEDTYSAHGSPDQMAATSGQLISFDSNTGSDVTHHTSGDYLKVGQQYIRGGSEESNSTIIGYVVKGGPFEGLNYTVPSTTHKPANHTWLRDPSWSPDGSRVVYSVSDWDYQRPADLPLFAFDDDWDYRFLDVFPQLHAPTGAIALTSKQLGDSSAVVWTPPTITTTTTTTAGGNAGGGGGGGGGGNNGTIRKALDVTDVWDTTNATEAGWIASGLGGAFQPSFSPAGDRVAVGLGLWFFRRTSGVGATVYVADVATGEFEDATRTDQSTLNAGFPSWSPDGSGDRIVYRLWNQTSGAPLGLRVLDLRSGETVVLTEGWDNTPYWSPDGGRIVFTRQTNWTADMGARWYDDRFDIMTIRPDGTGLTQLTDSEANDAHAVWSWDGKSIMWNSGMYGFRDECVLYDNTFQPYGQIMVMDIDGNNKKLVTDSLWEDSMPLYVPRQ